MALPPNDVLSKGFAAGIQIWLVFLLAFYLLGYPAPLSIVLGAIAGVAAGFIIGWWGIKEEPKKAEPVVEDSLEDVAQTRRRRKRFRASARHARKKQPFSWEMLRDNLTFWKRS